MIAQGHSRIVLQLASGHQVAVLVRGLQGTEVGKERLHKRLERRLVQLRVSKRARFGSSVRSIASLVGI